MKRVISNFIAPFRSAMVAVLSVLLLCSVIYANGSHAFGKHDRSSLGTVVNDQAPADFNSKEPVEATGFEEQMAQQESRQVLIHLRGATEYETVEIFNRLLSEVSIVSEIERIQMTIVSHRPGQCLTSWKIVTQEEDTFDIERMIYSMLKDLDPKGENNILSDLYFDVHPDDIELAKKIKPVFADLSVINFTVKYSEVTGYHRPDNSGLLYAGFD